MSWDFSDASLDFSQDCINFDGTNDCQAKGGKAPKAPLIRDDEDLLDIITMIARRLF